MLTSMIVDSIHSIQTEKRIGLRCRSQVTDSFKSKVKQVITIDEFYNNSGPTSFIDNFADILKIDLNRIRFTKLTSSSTFIEFVILPFDTSGDAIKASNDTNSFAAQSTFTSNVQAPNPFDLSSQLQNLVLLFHMELLYGCSRVVVLIVAIICVIKII